MGPKETYYMSTHKSTCLICGTAIYCCNDGWLSVGGHDGSGGCEDPPILNFCSEACGKEMIRRITEDITRIKQLQFEEDSR